MQCCLIKGNYTDGRGDLFLTVYIRKNQKFFHLILCQRAKNQLLYTRIVTASELLGG